MEPPNLFPPPASRKEIKKIHADKKQGEENEGRRDLLEAFEENPGRRRSEFQTG